VAQAILHQFLLMKSPKNSYLGATSYLTCPIKNGGATMRRRSESMRLNFA
jgi:hypothetical protein